MDDADEFDAEFDALFAAEFADDVLVELDGFVVGGVVGGRISHSNVSPLSTTTCPSPSPVPVPVVPLGTCTRIAPGVVQFHACAGVAKAKQTATATAAITALIVSPHWIELHVKLHCSPTSYQWVNVGPVDNLGAEPIVRAI